MRGLVLFHLITMFSLAAEARIFRFGSEVFAGYFNGTMGLSALGKDAYEGTSGSQTLFTDEPDLNYSGEMGILFKSEKLGFLLGLEFVYPEKVEAAGKNSSGTKLLDLDSKVRATIMKVGIQYTVSSSDVYRTYISFSGGLASLDMKNQYDLTSTGQTTYSMPATYNESAEASANVYNIDFGIEYNFADINTISLFGGYRYLSVDEWEYSESGTGFVGAYSKGSVVRNSDGTKKTTDLSGFYVGLGFRIYID